MLCKLRFVQNTGTCSPGQGWFVRNLGAGWQYKSSRGLGGMSRYSAQILICFIAYIFLFFSPLRVLVGNLAGLSPCTVPSESEWGWASDNQISQHALLRCSWMKTLSGIYTIGLVKLTYLCTSVILPYFSPEFRLISGVLELGQVRLF